MSLILGNNAEAKQDRMKAVYDLFSGQLEVGDSKALVVAEGAMTVKMLEGERVFLQVAKTNPGWVTFHAGMQLAGPVVNEWIIDSDGGFEAFQVIGGRQHPIQGAPRAQIVDGLLREFGEAEEANELVPKRIRDGIAGLLRRVFGK